LKNKATQLSERLLDYGVSIVKICVRLNNTAIGRHISRQLLRAGTSVGANYEEARGAQSRADFLHKLQIVLKEIRESMYWLKLAQRSDIVKTQLIQEAIDEAVQISAIIGKSVITAKRKR
jgi:four helix bundle protein